MDEQAAIEIDRKALSRIVATLLLLAGLAEHIAGLSGPARFMVLWLLRTAEGVAREFAAELVAKPQHELTAFVERDDSAAEAIRLAIRIRALAAVLGEMSRQSLLADTTARVSARAWPDRLDLTDMCPIRKSRRPALPSHDLARLCIDTS